MCWTCNKMESSEVKTPPSSHTPPTPIYSNLLIINPLHKSTTPSVCQLNPFKPYLSPFYLLLAITLTFKCNFSCTVFFFFFRNDWINVGLCYPQGTNFTVISDIHNRLTKQTRKTGTFVSTIQKEKINHSHLNRGYYYWEKDTGSDMQAFLSPVESFVVVVEDVTSKALLL